MNNFYWTAEACGHALRAQAVGEAADHFFTSRPLQLRGENGQEARDWARVAASIGVAPGRLLRLRQVHGNRVVVGRRDNGLPASSEPRRGDDGDSRWPDADIIVSDDPDVAVAVQVADCVPLLIADRRTGAVAAAHAGWRGTTLNVAGTTVAALAREFGSRPPDLVVAHGPSIGPCCYIVGEELLDAFRRANGAGVEAWFSRDGLGRLRLDLWAANRDQLVAAGVLPEHIHQAQLCTASHPDRFHSYRRDGKGTGRIAAVIRPRG